MPVYEDNDADSTPPAHALTEPVSPMDMLVSFTVDNETEVPGTDCDGFNVVDSSRSHEFTPVVESTLTFADEDIDLEPRELIPVDAFGLAGNCNSFCLESGFAFPVDLELVFPAAVDACCFAFAFFCGLVFGVDDVAFFPMAV